MNHVSLIGRLTRDPELRQMGDTDRQVCEMRIAVDNGDNDATFIDVATFDKQAKSCAEYLSKGRQVAVEGRLVYNEWEAEDGTKRSKHSVIGRVQFLGKGGSIGDEPQGEPVAAGVAEEDVPF